MKAEIEWVSVNDAMPKETTKILLCVDFGDNEYHVISGYFYSDNFYNGSSKVKGDVDYWSNSPKTPQFKK